MLEKQHFQLPKQNLTILYQSFVTKQHQPKLVDLSQASKLHSSLVVPEKTDVLQKPKPFEITTYRADGTYDDHRRPTTVTWGKTVEDDLARRDFTVNAMALKIPQHNLEEIFAQKVVPPTVALKSTDYTLVDPHKGVADLAGRLIKGEERIPFGPYLVLGAMVHLFWGNDIIAWYFNTVLKY